MAAIRLFILVGMLSVGLSFSAASQEGSTTDGILSTQTPGTAVGPTGEPIRLPPPPAALVGLIERGKVAFRLYDPEREPREFAGETKFDLQYQYRSTSRWTVTGSGANRTVTIRPEFHELKLRWTHTIQVPQAMADDRFFDKPLVRHEFDHVRISTNPALEQLFQKWTATELARLERPLPGRERPTNAWIQNEVKLATQKLFNRLLELVRIRYQELDRVTDHGRRPLPEDFF